MLVSDAIPQRKYQQAMVSSHWCLRWCRLRDESHKPHHLETMGGHSLVAIYGGIIRNQGLEVVQDLVHPQYFGGIWAGGWWSQEVMPIGFFLGLAET